MSNFYGGREGRSFIIAKSYSTVAEMVNDFRKGPFFTDVNFEEYVLINTINKANPENGQIFRRGHDYSTEETISSYYLEKVTDEAGVVKTWFHTELKSGGAEYIGTIAGPAGKAPQLYFGEYDEIVHKNRWIEIDGDNLLAITSFDEILRMLEKEYPEGYYPDAEDIENKYYNVRYKLPVRDDKGYIISGEYEYYFLHYDFLYKEISDSIGWYVVDALPLTPEENIPMNTFNPEYGLVPAVQYKKLEDGSYDYSIDEKGNKHLQIDTDYALDGYVKGQHNTIDWYSTSIRNENDEDTTAYIGFRFTSPVIELEVESQDAYYNRNDENESTTTFENINLLDRLDDESNAYYYKWRVNIPKGIKGESAENIRVTTLAEETAVGRTIEGYVDDEPDKGGKKKIYVLDYCNYDRVGAGDRKVIYIGDYNQIDNITLDEEGTLTIEYSHKETLIKEHLIHWITNMQFEDDGSIHIDFNNSDISQGNIKAGVIDLPQFMSWLTSFTIAEQGDIDITFNNQNNGVTDIHLPNYIKRIDSIVLQDTGDATDNSEANNQKIRVTYNTKTDGVNKDTEEISNPINYIMRVAEDDNRHLLILHSDPSRRAGGVTFDGISGWQDLGGIGYVMVHADDNSESLANEQNKLNTNGVWFVTKEV